MTFITYRFFYLFLLSLLWPTLSFASLPAHTISTACLAETERGNVITDAQVIGGNGTQFNTGYAYDAADRVRLITYPVDGHQVRYTRDAGGYVTKVELSVTSGSTWATIASAVTHDAFGPVSGFTYGNGMAHSRVRDDNGWLSSIATTLSGSTLQSLTYTRCPSLDDPIKLTKLYRWAFRRRPVLRNDDIERLRTYESFRPLPCPDDPARRRLSKRRRIEESTQ